MLRIVTGPFHPTLEDALARHILAQKHADPFARLALIVPSATLAERLKHLLTLDQQLSLLNLHVLTFHQLALRLVDESGNLHRPVRLADDLFFEQLVRHIVRSRMSTLAPLQHIGHSSGTWGALWSTIRDLKDAGVDQNEALRAVCEGQFERDEAGWLQALFTLLAAVKEAGYLLKVGAPDDLTESLIAHIPQSSFISGLAQVFYYGFYDLTQVQLSFFEAVSKTASTTLFFPLDRARSFDFARRFFEQYMEPLAKESDAVVRLAEAGAMRKPRTPPPVILSIRSVVGVEEELALVCRTILDLVETNGYRFEEIGVVARTLDPYREQLQSVFDRHCVPFTTTAGRPLIHEPISKVIVQLASLPLNDFYRTAVLDVVTSPHFHSPWLEEQRSSFRPDVWKLTVSALHITHGLAEWTRLEEASRFALVIDNEGEELNATDRTEIDREAVGLLWRAVSPLLKDCAELPKQGSITHLVECFRQLLSRHLRGAPTVKETDDGALVSRECAVREAIDRVLGSVTELEILGEEVSWEAFCEILTHAVERAMIPAEKKAHRGVVVLDAMAARGLPFKALFVVGLNEKVFPRYIKEDAFLRDRHRRVLEETLGFKIDEKLLGYEEETLLFNLLCQAARQHLYFSFQRADDQGRALAPSPFLADIRRRPDIDERLVESIPRRLTDRVAQKPAIRTFLPPMDLIRWTVLTDQDPSALLQAIGRDPEAFRHAVDATARMEEGTPVLNSFDGLTGRLDAHWLRLVDRGIAPTPLERYARCPFQYFAADVLKLEPIPVPPTEGPNAQLLGQLCHSALRRCYASLVSKGWPTKQIVEEATARCIRESIVEAAAECEKRYPTGPFLLWELAKNTVTGLVTAAVAADRSAYNEEGYVPVAFEVEAAGVLPDLPGFEETTLNVHGRVDRVDHRPGSNHIRIIDYKFKSGSEIKPDDRNLLQSAVRGFRLQAPLYSLLTMKDRSEIAQVELFFLAPNWDLPVMRSTFEASAWHSKAGQQFRTTLAILLDGIHQGRFFVLPNGYCDRCEFRVACRREHLPTWWRSHRASETKTLNALRTIKVKNESH